MVGATERRKRLLGLGTGLLLFFFALLILLERLHTKNEPWFCDVSFYASMGSEMNQGRQLYSDLWDDRPPATYVTYALAEKVLGNGRDLALWIGFWSAVATMLGLFVAGKGLSGKTSGGLWAAGLYALISCDAVLESHQPNVEYFMNACVVWALALLVWKFKDRTPWWVYAWIGNLWAWLALYKQFMAVEALAVGLAYGLTAVKKERVRALKGIGLAWAVALAIGLGTIAYFYATGRGQVFYDTIFIYGRYYAGDVAQNLLVALLPHFLFPGWFWYAAPLAVLSLAAVWMARQGKSRWSWVFLSFLLVKFLEKALPGRFFRHHYYQVWVPALCLGAAWGLVLLAERYKGRRAWVARAAGIVVVLCLGIHQLTWFSKPSIEWNRYNYGMDYDDEDQIVEQVSLLLKPEETFYEWAEYPRFYYATGRRVPVGILFGAHLMNGGSTYSGGPFADKFTARNLEDLERNQPQMVIWDKDWPPKEFSGHPVSAYILSHYRAFAAYGERGRFEFWCRIGGELDQRLRGTGSKNS